MRRLVAGLIAAGLALSTLAGPVAARMVPPLGLVGEPEVQSERASPRVCLTFEEKIAPEQAAPLDSYVATDSGVRLTARPDENRLCLEGMHHGETYRLTLHAGLKGASGRETTGQSLDISIPDRAPQLRFASTGFVLPRVDSAGLPLETINLDKARLLVLRVSDSDVIEKVRNGEISRRISYFTVGQVASRIGTNIWTGTIDIENRPNAAVRTAIPVDRILPDDKTGLYLAVAEQVGDSDRREYWATAQWFVVSDIGLSVFRAADGLTVLARSVAGTEPLPDVSVRLIAQDGHTLTTATTDDTGVARIAAGWLRGEENNRPRALYADGHAGDFVMIDFDNGAVDLTGLGMEGRTAPGTLDAYVTTERGIYRPGETVHLTALLRTDRSKAVTGLPLQLSVRRQDGVEVWNRVLAEAGAGGYATVIDLPPNAMTGRWSATVTVGKDTPPLGTVQFQVEDFVPPRLEMTLEAERRDDAIAISTRADFLYGAPGSDLGGEAGLLIRAASAPSPAHKGYSFGLADEADLEPRQRDSVRFTTGPDGTATAELPLGALPATSRPLEALVRASVFDTGGRPVSRTTRVQLGNLPLLIGIRPDFAGTHVATGSTAGFDIVALDPQGRPVARDLDVRIVRETVEYIWYKRYESWDYQVVRSDAGTVLDQELAVQADGPGQVAQAFADWGHYRIEAVDRASGAASSLRFMAGWWGAAPGDEDPAPELVALGLPPGEHRAGDEVELRVEPPFTGGVQVTVADSEVRDTVVATVPQGGGTVRVKLPEAGPAGVWLLVNAFGAPDGVRSQAPRRAVGAIHVPYDQSGARLDVSLDAPAETLPQTTVPVRVTFGPDQAGADTFVSLAAVDDGVLQLTGFGAPDPAVYFLRARRPGIELFDLYGRFIDAAGSKRGRVRSGGDEAAMANSAQLANLPRKSEPVVALFSGIVRVGTDGSATIPLDIPDFDGRLRLMAQAWSPTRVGKASQALTVRRPMLASLSLPRFLAPGDSATVTASLRNLAAAEGTWSAAIIADGALSATGEPLATYLRPGDTARLTARLFTTTPGTGSVTLRVTGPDGSVIERRRMLDVRAGYPAITRRYLSEVQPGGSLAADPSLADGLFPASVRISVGINPLPDFDLPGILAGLNRYPYGCAEQTTSTAMPLLALPGLMKELGITARDSSRKGVGIAIDRLSAMQSADGGFGVWRAGDSSNDWLSAYVTEFLVRADKAGFDVPRTVLDRALRNMSDVLGRVGHGGYVEVNAAAYAAHVLAQAGIADPATVIRIADFGFERTRSLLAQAQFAAAVSLVGDSRSADAMFARLGEPPVEDFWRHEDYGSSLRDRAAALALMAESGHVAWSTLVARAGLLADRLHDDDWLSTQEQGWTVRAAHALMQYPVRGTGLSVDDATVELAAGQPWYRTVATAADLPRVRNTGDTALHGVVSVTGVPMAAPPAGDDGFRISRRIVDRNGRPLDPALLAQNDIVIVILSGERGASGPSQALLVDWLPAGLEPENEVLGGESTTDRPWLGQLSTTAHEERRDDRFVAALDLEGTNGPASRRTFRVAYVARAVTPGTYTWPGTWIEDMYRPQQHGIAAAAEVRIAPR
ncbi:MAG: alpha-2-macroglobulin [Pseudomonadota bacterium]|nr:alpha-2-macroglobulin [Pseudomonadota bacterium]